ncbi:MAG TPA: hypothetical protein VM536_06460 [Chloroflexia bacterium]|nr:hypothetical protein [Chloroflexia bacterium]
MTRAAMMVYTRYILASILLSLLDLSDEGEGPWLGPRQGSRSTGDEEWIWLALSPMPDKLSEHAIQIAIMEYLALKGVFAWRNNTGMATYGHRKVRFGKVGSADTDIWR